MAALIHSLHKLYDLAKATPHKTWDYEKLKTTSEDARIARAASSMFMILGALCFSSVAAVITTVSTIIWIPTAICLIATTVACVALSLLFNSKATKMYGTLAADPQYEKIFLQQILKILDNLANSQPESIKTVEKSIEEFNQVLDINDAQRKLIKLDKLDDGINVPVLKINKIFTKDKDNAELEILAKANAKFIPVLFRKKNPCEPKSPLFIQQYLERIFVKWCLKGNLTELPPSKIELINRQMKCLNGLSEACYISREEERMLTFSTKCFHYVDLIIAVRELRKYPQLKIKLRIPPLTDAETVKNYKQFAIEHKNYVNILQ